MAILSEPNEIISHGTTQNKYRGLYLSYETEGPSESGFIFIKKKKKNPCEALSVVKLVYPPNKMH